MEGACAAYSQQDTQDSPENQRGDATGKGPSRPFPSLVEILRNGRRIPGKKAPEPDRRSRCPISLITLFKSRAGSSAPRGRYVLSNSVLSNDCRFPQKWGAKYFSATALLSRSAKRLSQSSKPITPGGKSVNGPQKSRKRNILPTISLNAQTCLLRLPLTDFLVNFDVH